MKLKRGLSIFLCVVIAAGILTLGGCAGSGAEKAPEKAAEKNEISQVLRIAQVGDTGTMNPHLYDSDMGSQTMVYEPLVNLDQKGNIVPWLAESWKYENDGLSLVFQLREDVKFTDGQEFNAKAVKQNFDAVLANATRHSWLPLIDNLKSVEVTGPFTVVLNMKAPYAFTLLELTMVRPVRFLSPGGFGPDGIAFEKPIGTGPFVLKEYVKNEKAVFVRNEGYWGAKPKLEQIVIRPVPDSNTRLNALLAGEVDLIAGSGVTAVSYQDLKNLKNNASLETKVETGDVAQFLHLNPSDEILKEKAVREAIALGIDRKEISDVAFEGMESVSETMFSTKVPEVLGRAKGLATDVQKAKAVLAGAGWSDTNGDGFVEKNGKVLEILYNIRTDNTTQKTVAEIVQSQLAKIGIKVNISAVESTVYYKRRDTGEFALMPDITWGIQYDPQSIYKSFRDSRPYLAPAFKGEADTLFKEALKTLEADSRREKFDKIANIFMNEEFIVIPTTVTPNVAVYNKKVDGFEFSANVWELGQNLTRVEIIK